MLCYRLKLEPDDNGTILVTSPDLPIVTEAVLSSMMDAREDIPAPAIRPRNKAPVLRLPLQSTLKIELYIAMRAAGLTRADLQRRLGWKRESIDRLFRLDHNSRLEQIEAAMNAVGKRFEIEIKEQAEV
jgi:antitoxin HicB